MQTEKIQIKQSDHSKYDCIPLRFGFLPQSDFGYIEGFEDKKGTQDQKPREQKAGNKRYRGKLFIKNELKIEDGTFVLKKQSKYRLERLLISVLPKEVGLATRAVSDLIRGYREDGDFSPEFIIKKLHPLYKQGAMEDEKKLFTELLKMGIEKSNADNEQRAKKSKAEMEADIEREVEKRVEQRLKEIAQEEDRRVAESQAQDQKLEEHVGQSVLKDKNSDPQYKGEEIDMAPICTLQKVWVGERTNYSGKVVRCTYLSFYENVPVRKMDQWADPSGQKTNFAQSLIGKAVQTTTWKPSIFHPLEWFRNIYPVASHLLIEH